MPLTRSQKQEILSDLTSAMRDAKSVAFIAYNGTSVADLETLRADVREVNGRIIVAKSTLLERVMADLNWPALTAATLAQPLAVVVATEDEILPVKAIAKFAKTHQTIAFVSGVLESQLLDAAQMKSLALIPSKPELIAKTVGSIKAPLSGFVGVLSGTLRGFVAVLSQISSRSTAPSV